MAPPERRPGLSYRKTGNSPPTFVTRPDMPPLEEFLPYLDRIWSSSILTNNGPIHAELEAALCARLGVDHLSLFSSGTLALAAAVKALGTEGEVITTPYSFIATSHVLKWTGLTPVFVDIDEDTFCLDAERIKAAITPRTRLILPVHCYGFACDVDGIADVAARRGLKVVYDAAAAFDVSDRRGSILLHGDLSVLSFHATKVFSTFEGGAVVARDAETKKALDRLKNFGFDSTGNVIDFGINAKMSEIHAAFGLTQLNHVDRQIARRKAIATAYVEALNGIEGLRLPEFAEGWAANHAYFPIRVAEPYPLTRDELFDTLADNGIHCRKYFSPLISELPMYRDVPSADPGNLPVASRIARQVICLPIYPALADDDIARIVQIISQGKGRTLRY